MCGGDSFGPRYAAEQPARYNGESPHFVDDVCDRWSGLRVLRLPPTNCVGRTLIRTRTGRLRNERNKSKDCPVGSVNATHSVNETGSNLC